MPSITTENCFNDSSFSAWWDRAYEYIEENHYRSAIMGCPDDGWRLDSLVDSYNKGMDEIAAVDDIVDNYDPTP